MKTYQGISFTIIATIYLIVIYPHPSNGFTPSNTKACVTFGNRNINERISNTYTLPSTHLHSYHKSNNDITQEDASSSSSSSSIHSINKPVIQKAITSTLVISTLMFSNLFGFISPEDNFNSHAAAAAEKEPIIWKSGKTPVIPGKKPKDKNDTTGTRKDTDFLRSIANCKNQCENSYGPDGFARSKEECLSDCQDICCKTYEQCTFAIVPRL